MVLQEIMAAWREGAGERLCRIVHLVTGDGAPVNMAACKRLWRHMCGIDKLEYRLVTWVCVTHQVNLSIKAAVRESDTANLIEATAVRMFIY